MPNANDDHNKPYIAANGHKMKMGSRWSDAKQKMYYSSAWAYCTDDCPACAAGGNLYDYAGEEE